MVALAVAGLPLRDGPDEDPRAQVRGAVAEQARGPVGVAGADEHPPDRPVAEHAGVAKGGDAELPRRARDHGALRQRTQDRSAGRASGAS